MATKKTATKKAPAKKAPAKKAPAKKAPVKKAPAKKAPAKKAPAKKVPAKKAAAKSVKKSMTAKAADRARVSTQGHEVAYLAKKHNVNAKTVTAAIKKVGNMRTNVETAIKNFKVRSTAADKALVSREPHEINYLAKQYNLASDKVMAVVRQHGPSRKKVEAALAKFTK